MGKHKGILLGSLIISFFNQLLVIAVTWIMALGLRMDVSDWASVQAMAERTTEQFGGIDLLVNGEVQLLVNTPLGKRSQKDDYSLRQVAITQRVPYTTTLSGASAASDAILSLREGPKTVRSLQEWLSDIV